MFAALFAIVVQLCSSRKQKFARKIAPHGAKRATIAVRIGKLCSAGALESLPVFSFDA